LLLSCASVVLIPVVVAVAYVLALRRYAPGIPTFGAAAGNVTVWRLMPVPVEPRNAGTGDLSEQLGMPLLQLLAGSALNSAVLVILAVCVSMILGVPLGLWIGMNPERQAARALHLLSGVLLAFPSFFVAFLLQLVVVHLSTAFGAPVIPVYGAGFDGHLIIPTVALMIPSIGLVARLSAVRAAEIQGREFVRTARAKGLDEGTVLANHIVPMMLVTFGEAALGACRSVLAAIVILEYLLVWPGLGILALRAVNVQDPRTLLASTTVLGVAFLSASAGLDLVRSRRVGR
jgi:ABC-type dipeptide/oligopeptide/nickel transport system permease component